MYTYIKIRMLFIYLNFTSYSTRYRDLQITNDCKYFFFSSLHELSFADKSR